MNRLLTGIRSVIGQFLWPRPQRVGIPHRPCQVRAEMQHLGLHLISFFMKMDANPDVVSNPRSNPQIKLQRNTRKVI